MTEYLKMLQALRNERRTFQSNFARSNSNLIAEAASRGHISCLDANGRNTNMWHVTTLGVMFISNNECKSYGQL